MGSLGWKVLGTSAAVVAGLAARKLVETGWKASTGYKPPENPEDPRVDWKVAMGWAMAEGVLIGMARLFAMRKAAEYYTRSTGHAPAGMAETDAEAALIPA